MILFIPFASKSQVWMGSKHDTPKYRDRKNFDYVNKMKN